MSTCYQPHYSPPFSWRHSLQALMSLFVLSCKDGWVSIMYDGLDAVGVDQQVNERSRSGQAR